MELISISLLLYLIASSMGMCDPSCCYPPPYHPNTICGYCFPKPQSNVHVSDLINTPDHDYKRLVVYLYYDARGNENKIYIPGPEKQRHIPELTVDKPDVVANTPGTNHVNDIIKSFDPLGTPLNQINSNAVQGNVPPIYNIDAVPDPIGLSTGQIESEIRDSGYIGAPLDIDVNNLIIEGAGGNRMNPAPNALSTDPHNPEQVIMEPQNFGAPNVVNIIENEPGSTNEEKNLYNYIPPQTPFNHPELLNPHEHHKQSPHHYANNKPHVTFDKWFDHQMEQVDKTNPGLKSLDLETLKELIEDTLQQYGMHVTDDGILRNAKDQAFNLDNLNLRHVLIGKSLTYDYVLKNNLNKLDDLYNRAYMEGLMVSLLNPPKILGIIPLGKLFLYGEQGQVRVAGSRRHRTSHKHHQYRTLAPYYNSFDYFRREQKELRDEPVEKSIADNLESKKSIVSSRILFPKLKKKPESEPDFRRYGEEAVKNYLAWRKKSRRTSLGEKYKKKTRKSLSDKSRNSSGEKSRRAEFMFEINNILKSVYDRMLGSYTDKNEKKVPKKLREPVQEIDYEEEKEEEEEEEEEIPGYRIVGGNAATGSGTPVNSRGRSGWSNEDII